MKTKYKEIQFEAGTNIESAINTLLEYQKFGEKVFGSFNGHKLYSDIDDIDSAYKKVTGKTKAENDKADKKRDSEYEEQKRKHKESIPELTKEWVEKGKNVLDKKYLPLWNECVPIRLDDLYKGMELGDCLEIVTELNKGCKLDVAKKILEKQGHSGMSFGLVCSMVRSFCDRGNDFVNYIK